MPPVIVLTGVVLLMHCSTTPNGMLMLRCGAKEKNERKADGTHPGRIIIMRITLSSTAPWARGAFASDNS